MPRELRIEKSELLSVLVHFWPILGELANSKGELDSELGNIGMKYSPNFILLRHALF